MRELDVRRALRAILEDEYSGSATLIVDELAVGNGRRRVDVAIVNGELAGHEIKSEADTLSRLAEQSEAYNQVFDRMWLVVAERHYANALEIIPPWWGLRLALRQGGGVTIAESRAASSNPGGQDPVAIAQLLWREEALALLVQYGLGDSQLRRGSKRHMYVALADALDLETLKGHVRTALKSRDNWR